VNILSSLSLSASAVELGVIKIRVMYHCSAALDGIVLSIQLGNIWDIVNPPLHHQAPTLTAALILLLLLLRLPRIQTIVSFHNSIIKNVNIGVCTLTICCSGESSWYSCHGHCFSSRNDGHDVATIDN